MIRVLHETDYQISNWSGGKTIQLAIYPENSDYSKRNFLWRISSATVDLPESDFTALPDYLRQITPISGEMTLQHDGETRIPIPVGTIHTFDGGAVTHSWGCCTDFNLMLRKGHAEGTMQRVFCPAEEAYHVTFPNGFLCLLYCTQGSLRISGTTITVVQGDTLITDEPVTIQACEDCVLMEAEAST